mmetsp:Transcript_6090/g.19875  ORF Transcript_6090/g.19875 Transcript_6090/m.19875 type:complete len:314 (+) Transcript_6090:2154-3095(+)
MVTVALSPALPSTTVTAHSPTTVPVTAPTALTLQPAPVAVHVSFVSGKPPSTSRWTGALRKTAMVDGPRTVRWSNTSTRSGADDTPATDADTVHEPGACPTKALPGCTTRSTPSFSTDSETGGSTSNRSPSAEKTDTLWRSVRSPTASQSTASKTTRLTLATVTARLSAGTRSASASATDMEKEVPRALRGVTVTDAPSTTHDSSGHSMAYEPVPPVTVTVKETSGAFAMATVDLFVDSRRCGTVSSVMVSPSLALPDALVRESDVALVHTAIAPSDEGKRLRPSPATASKRDAPDTSWPPRQRSRLWSLPTR